MTRLVLLQNIRSLYKNFSNLEVLNLELEIKPAAIVLTETLCSENTNEIALVLNVLSKKFSMQENKKSWGLGNIYKKQHEYQIIKRTTNHRLKITKL